MSGWIQMAASGQMMRIGTVFAAGFKPQNAETIQDFGTIGTTWGSWKTWRDCATQNVICHDITKAQELCQKAMHAVCKLHVPESFFATLGRPTGLVLYQGQFQNQIQDIEDIISMNLAQAQADVILLLGYQLGNPGVVPDKAQATRIKHRLGLIRSCLSRNSQTQWVIIDHEGDPDQAFTDLPNVTCDSYANVLNLL